MWLLNISVFIIVVAAETLLFLQECNCSFPLYCYNSFLHYLLCTVIVSSVLRDCFDFDSIIIIIFMLVLVGWLHGTSQGG